MLKKREFPFTQEEFKKLYAQIPRLCVDAIIQDEEGRFVLLKRDIKDSNFGKWHFPGGTVYFREPIDQAVKRIVSEEIGLDVNIEGLVGFIEFLDEERDGEPFHAVSLAIVCTPQTQLSEDSEDYSVFTDVPENMVHQHAEFMQGFLSDSCLDPECGEVHRA